MRKKIKLSLILLTILLVMPFLSANEESYIIANSQSWQDVYSAMLYSSLQEIGGDFLTNTQHGTTILNGIKKENSILVVSSSDSPYVFNYPDLIKANGFKSAREITAKNANIQLIDELPDIRNFVIVGDSYGYDSIAVTPYAVQKKSWVFLSNKININEIDSTLSRRNIDEILIYGYVDREVRDILEKYNPKIIDTKNRFEDNIEITKEYLKINPTKQVLLTNGEFIEKQLMLGTEPTLFTGKENVPDQIRDYLKDSPIEIGILIGNELIGTATNIKKSTGINVMVKFARGARSQEKGVSAVEGLDLFPVPTPSISLSIHSIKYNIINSQIELTYKSESNIPVYFKGVITINGNKIGDAEANFIAPGNFKTMVYSLETQPEDLSANVFTLYGESASSLDRILEKTIDVNTVEVLDNCEIDLTEAKYNKQKKEFKIRAENLADVDCWANIEITNLKVGYNEITSGTITAEKISAKKSKTISIKEELNEEDLLQNQIIEVTARYGEREDGLVKTKTKTLTLATEFFSGISYGIMTIVLTIIILLITIWILRKKDEEGY
ncbi:MAG: hypothetical protein PVJ67_03125 [Candidatus Pacearchaeota archaeon]|jgi:hypothetical protein